MTGKGFFRIKQLSGIFLILIFPQQRATGESDLVPIPDKNPVAYTCCSAPGVFKGDSCKTDETSEFDSFQSRWKVPEILRVKESNSTIEYLELETIPAKKLCGEALRVYQNFTRNSDSNFKFKLGANFTTSKAPPKFFKNGSMTYDRRLYYPSGYCFDRLLEQGDYSEFDIVVFPQKNGCSRQVLGISAPGRNPNREPWIKQVFAAVAGLSCLFTLVDIILYLTLRNYLNVSGWTEFAYFVSLGVFSALSVVELLYEPADKTAESPEIPCHILSLFLQFFKIATYVSYVMITFEVHWMLRKSINMGSYGEDTAIESKTRLVFYYILVLCIPLGIAIYGLVLNHGSTEYEDEPSYGLKVCSAPKWIVTEYLNYGLESLTFFVILLSINLILGRLGRSAEVDDAPRISLLTNMFFFTLFYWIVDLLQFARPLFSNCYSHAEGVKSSQETFWTVLEGFGYAQGILAFVVFVFNRKTLRAFRRRAGSNGTLREIFRHACCSSGKGVTPPPEEFAATPMSPLMKSTSMRRSTVRQSHLY